MYNHFNIDYTFIGDNMYLLSNLLLKSDDEKIKKAYIKTYNYLCQDNIPDVESFELINGKIPTADIVFIEKLINTIIEDDELYDQVISIYQ